MDIVKKIRIVVVMTFVIFAFTKNAFAEGPGDLRSQKVAIVGDSYAGHFSINEGIDGYEYFIFPVGTINNVTNELVFESAINADTTYILFATGVNDQALNTDLKVFESELRKYIEEIKSKGKYLFLHTYMEYANMKYGSGSHLPSEYDKVYKRLADEYDNVFYIDMSAFNSKRYDFGDGVHYNKAFYDALNAKMRFYVHAIEKSVFHAIGTDVKKEYKTQIAVAGDIAAYDFFDQENKKDYVMTDFSTPGKLLRDCKENILNAINYEAQNVFITLGIKDYEEQTNIENFKDDLRQCLNQASIKHKSVFIYTSLDYGQDKWLPITISDYDTAIENVANEYPGTCYINLRSYTKDNPQIYDMVYSLMDNMIKNIY